MLQGFFADHGAVPQGEIEALFLVCLIWTCALVLFASWRARVSGREELRSSANILIGLFILMGPLLKVFDEAAEAQDFKATVGSLVAFLCIAFVATTLALHVLRASRPPAP